MAQLTNRRWEAFAINLASGAPLRTAFIGAGYKDSYSAPYNASRLRNHPAVRERVNELLREFSKESFVSLTWIQEKLVEIIDGKAPAKIRIDAKGERSEEVDRIGALTVLARSIGAGGDGVTVNAVAIAQANAATALRTDSDRAKALSALMAKIRARSEAFDIDPKQRPAWRDREAARSEGSIIPSLEPKTVVDNDSFSAPPPPATPPAPEGTPTDSRADG